MQKYKVVSLFSGAGGLDLGFVQTGKYEIIFANDVFIPATKTYEKNFGLRQAHCKMGERAEASAGEVLACDVAQVGFSALRGADVVIGGPPCQDFSIVRGPTRQGIEAQRGKLYAHFVRALAEIQPQAFVFENVPGLASANGGLAYETILEDFANLHLRWGEIQRALSQKSGRAVAEGYEIIFHGVVNFADFGVPQGRKRLLIIGVKKNVAVARAALENALRNATLPFRFYPLTPIEVFEGARLDALESKYREVMKAWDGVWDDANTQMARAWKQKVWDKLSFSALDDYVKALGDSTVARASLGEALVAHEKLLKALGYYSKPVCAQGLGDKTCDLPNEKKAVVERMKLIPPGESMAFLRGTKFFAKGLMSLYYARIHPLRPAYTVLAYGGGGTQGYHYERERSMLTLRERARLQTFPDEFLFSGSKAEIRAQIGEAVPPLAGKVVAEALAELLDRKS